MFKKFLAFAALAVVSMVASAQTFVAEWDHHKFAGSTDRSDYVAFGFAFPTSVGTFDAYVQGVRATTSEVRDYLSGWEVGYSKGVSIGKATLTPRIAYGAMNAINMGGYNDNARYMLGSAELGFPLTATISGYFGISHMKGLNAAAIQSQNRAQVGLDFVVTEKLTLRAGYSYIHQYQTNQDGLVTMLFYSF